MARLDGTERLAEPLPWQSRSPLAALLQLLEPVRAGDEVVLLRGARKCMGDVGGEAAPRSLTARPEVLSPSPRALQDSGCRILAAG
jgi:hypothetical protein